MISRRAFLILPVGFGLSLRRQGAWWVVTGLEPVVDEQWARKFIELFQQTHPVAEEVALDGATSK